MKVRLAAICLQDMVQRVMCSVYPKTTDIYRKIKQRVRPTFKLNHDLKIY